MQNITIFCLWASLLFSSQSYSSRRPPAQSCAELCDQCCEEVCIPCCCLACQKCCSERCAVGCCLMVMAATAGTVMHFNTLKNNQVMMQNQLAEQEVSLARQRDTIKDLLEQIKTNCPVPSFTPAAPAHVSMGVPAPILAKDWKGASPRKVKKKK